MKKVLSVLIMLFSILLLGILVGCYHDNHIISRKEEKAYTVAELKEMYDVYHDDFNDVAKIVLKNDPMKQAMINTNEGVASFETTSVKDFFTQDEWDTIERLFHETGLFRIERSSKGSSENDTVKFFYGISISTTILYYCQTDNESDMDYFRQDSKQFEKIESNWWIGYQNISSILGVSEGRFC